jgi:dipeptidyl aminopeptidase/acylaminoacyl peptidase
VNIFKIEEMKGFIYSTIVFSMSILFLNAQTKKPLDHQAFDTWNEIENPQISNDGNWVLYVIKPGKGNPRLGLYNGKSGKTVFFERGSEGMFTSDNQYLMVKIIPDADTVAYMKEQKMEKDDFPTDTLLVFHLDSGDEIRRGGLKKWYCSSKWKEGMLFESRDTLHWIHFKSKREGSLGLIDQVAIAKDQEKAVFAREDGDSTQEAGIFLWEAFQDSIEVRPIYLESGSYEQLTLSDNGHVFAFLLDTAAQEFTPNYALHYGFTNQNQVTELRGDSILQLPRDWGISKYGQLTVGANDQKIFFGTSPHPIVGDPDDEDAVNVEVWTWQDPVLYTRQESSLKRDREKTYGAVVFIENNKARQLASDSIPQMELINEGKSNLVLLWADEAYQSSFDYLGGPTSKDVYLKNIKSGDLEKVAEGLRATPRPSPAGKYLYWYAYEDSLWMAYRIADRKLLEIAGNEGIQFYRMDDDHPDFPPPYGMAGWTTSDDFILLYDQYDIWMLDPTGSLKPNNLSNGRKNRKIARYIQVDPEEKAIEEVAPMLFHFVEEDSRKEGYKWYNLHTGVKDVVKEGPYKLMSRPIKAKNADKWVFTRENYETFPNLIYSDRFSTEVAITNANPQQEEYAWGTIEHFYWTGTNGEKLRGLLAKPDNFDPSVKYPMIVNFYEKSSNALFNHRAPYPHRSQINYSFYTSRGYLVFNPDIPYDIGYPGESAYNSVVSGTIALIDKGFVDEAKIGIQGHSWGGYQIAHILTKTSLFACAESGAPVVNMFSAYGGIRWGTGMSRQFQYEHTQSRIGGTIWEYPMRFWENSPLFFLDKVNTPVLILHNDEDAAVPWYQGIEYFMGLRRLGKPAWLLNYNGEPHWPVKRKNRLDFQLRMQQFFDYYLQEAPMPLWMEKGVPAIQKGIQQNLELKE